MTGDRILGVKHPFLKSIYQYMLEVWRGFALVKGILCLTGFDFAGPQSCRISKTVSTTHLQEGSGYPLRLCNESSIVLWLSSLPNELTVISRRL